MIPNAPELNKKVTLSWYALLAIIIVAVTVTGTAVKVLDNDAQREQQKETLEKQIEANKQFLLDEVSGLRSDWERRYRDNIDRRLSDLEEKDKK